MRHWEWIRVGLWLRRAGPTRFGRRLRTVCCMFERRWFSISRPPPQWQAIGAEHVRDTDFVHPRRVVGWFAIAVVAAEVDYPPSIGRKR